MLLERSKATSDFRRIYEIFRLFDIGMNRNGLWLLTIRLFLRPKSRQTIAI